MIEDQRKIKANLWSQSLLLQRRSCRMRKQAYKSLDIILWILIPVVLIVTSILAFSHTMLQQSKMNFDYYSTVKSDVILTFGALGNYGRLGNQFFQVASTIGLALSHGIAWDFSTSIRNTEIGVLCNLQGSLQQADIDNSIVVREESGNYYNISLPINSKGVISLFGYFQSPLYFDKNREDLKKLFKINPQITRRILNELPEIKSPQTVAVHVRRGDYLSLGHIYRILGMNYFEMALSLLDGIDTIVVASDDIDWCRQIFSRLPYKIIFSSFEDHLHDFALLALSQNLIISNSSFSWWAAYLKMLHFGNGTVIAPKPWYTVDGPLANLNRDGFYLSHWKLIDS